MGSTVRTLLEESLYLSVADSQFDPIDPVGSQINVALNIFIGLLDTYRNYVPFFALAKIPNFEGLTDFKATL